MCISLVITFADDSTSVLSATILFSLACVARRPYARVHCTSHDLHLRRCWTVRNGQAVAWTNGQMDMDKRRPAAVWASGFRQDPVVTTSTIVDNICNEHVCIHACYGRYRCRRACLVKFPYSLLGDSNHACCCRLLQGVGERPIVQGFIRQHWQHPSGLYSSYAVSLLSARDHFTKCPCTHWSSTCRSRS